MEDIPIDDPNSQPNFVNDSRVPEDNPDPPPVITVRRKKKKKRRANTHFFEPVPGAMPDYYNSSGYIPNTSQGE
jgi:hypothetical protein